MRLLLCEHKDILTVLESHGFEKDKYAFRKKRGWVHIDIFEFPSSFSFHRKKDVELIDNKFEERLSYQINYDSRTQDIPSWLDVIEALRGWIDASAK